MSKYIKEINNKYITEFKIRLRNGFNSLLRSSDSMYMRTILKELNRLFKIMAGRISSKLDIPKNNEFPDTAKFNTLLESLDIDIDKIYKAESIIESDLQNVVNFNSLEREKQINNLAKVQQSVYSAYIKSKKGLIGTTIIREDFKTDKISKESTGVQVNLNKEVLMLQVLSSSINRKSVDNRLVECLFVEFPDEKYNIFPSNKSLALGAFWKTSNNRSHFNGKIYPTWYRTQMVDDASPTSVSSCQFEAMYTFDEDGKMRDKIENELGNYFQLHHTFIMVDKSNSVHGEYTSTENIEYANVVTVRPNIKLSIPFKTHIPASTSLIVDVEPNDSNIIPTIDIDKSFTEDVNGRKINFVSVDKKKIESYNKTGRYQLDFTDPIVPIRVELILSYSSASWSQLKEYLMAGYIYEKSKVFQLEINDGSSVSTTLRKVAWVFVDAQMPLKKEEQRANKVMSLVGVKK